jgi:hypothetical protein
MRAREVTKDMVRDLLPVYLAGEASADTRAVVEAFLTQDAELREIVEAARNCSLPPLEAPASLELQSLERTRRLLGRKNFWLGFALIFSLAPLILKPWWLADFVLLIGLGAWVPLLTTCRELKATGLEALRGWFPRLFWSLVGFQLGWTAGYLIREQIGGHWGNLAYNGLWVVGSSLALWFGEKFHQIQTGEELNRPMTLFGK